MRGKVFQQGFYRREHVRRYRSRFVKNLLVYEPDAERG